MVTESYVSFEIAKLLKEKGFDEYCKSVYHVGSVCSVASLGYHNNEGYGEVIDEKQNSDFGKYDNAISAPTLQMATKWLRENYCLYIDIELLSGPSFSWYIWFMNDPKHMMGCSEDIRHYYDAYEEACEAAIKYCLENLI